MLWLIIPCQPAHNAPHSGSGTNGLDFSHSAAQIVRCGHKAPALTHPFISGSQVSEYEP